MGGVLGVSHVLGSPENEEGGGGDALLRREIWPAWGREGEGKAGGMEEEVGAVL